MSAAVTGGVAGAGDVAGAPAGGGAYSGDNRVAVVELK